MWECYRYHLCKIKISVSEFVYRNKNIKRLMQDYSNLMSQLLTFNFKTRRTTNTKLGNVLTFMWIQHKKQNTYKIISYRKSLKETFWKTAIVENSNEFEIHHSILFNNGFHFRKSLIKCSCSYFRCICLSQGN